MGMVTSKHLQYAAVTTFVLSLILLSTALALPRFLTLGGRHRTPVATYNFSEGLGAFQYCIDSTKTDATSVTRYTGCSFVTSDCLLRLTDGEYTKSPEDIGVHSCAAFNAFRGLLVTAVVLLGLTMTTTVWFTFCRPSNSPQYGLRVLLAVLVTGCLTLLFLICSLGQFYTAAPEIEETGVDYTVATKRDASLYLAAVSGGIIAAALALWTVAERLLRKEMAMEGEEAAGVPAAPLVPPPSVEEGGGAAYRLPPPPAAAAHYVEPPAPQSQHQQLQQPLIEAHTEDM